MSFIDDYLASDLAKGIVKNNKKASTYAVLYPYYRDYLLGRILRIFEWTNAPVDQRHIELPMLISGMVWTTRYAGEIISNFGTTGRMTDIYMDEVLTGFCHTNRRGDIPLINHKTGVYGRNDTLAVGVMGIIHIYADLMTHAHLTFINALVNGRSDQIFKASEGSTAESVNNFIKQRWEGKQTALVDDLAVLADVINCGDSNSNILSLEEVQEKLLTRFYKEFGIKTESDKKERLVVDEVNEDNASTSISIADMLECRAKFIEDAAALYPEWEGTTVKARVDYMKEGGEAKNEDE